MKCETKKYISIFFCYFSLQKASFQQITKAYTVLTGETCNKNEIILRDWLIWMFYHFDFWTLVSSS